MWSLALPRRPLLRIPARPDGPHEDLVDAFSRLAARASRCGAHRHRRSIPTARADPRRPRRARALPRLARRERRFHRTPRPGAPDDRSGQGRPQQHAGAPQARLPLAPDGRAGRTGALRRRGLGVPVGHRPPAHLALPLVRHGARRIRRRRLAGLVRHRSQDHARQGRAHPVGDGLRQVRRGGSQFRARAGGPGEHRPPPAREHQARGRARRAPALGLHGLGAGPPGAARARARRARGGRRRLRPRRLPRLPRPRPQPEPGPARDCAHALPPGPVRRRAALLRGRRVGRHRHGRRLPR